MSDMLTEGLLREQGYQRHDAAGYINCLGVSVQNGIFTRAVARWDIYERGQLAADPDAEAITITVLEEVDSRPLHSLVEDPFDLCKRARGNLLSQGGCEGTITAIDLGGSQAGGEGYLLGTQIRTEIGHGVYALRTVSDADLPRPVWDGTHQGWKMAPEALTGALAARAGARQVLISDDATTEARRIFTDALRQAGPVDPRSAPPLTRLIAWMAEIFGRPLAQPLVSRDPNSFLMSKRQEHRGGVRIMR